jgi:hypothetical protein
MPRSSDWSCARNPTWTIPNVVAGLRTAHLLRFMSCGRLAGASRSLGPWSFDQCCRPPIVRPLLILRLDAIQAGLVDTVRRHGDALPTTRCSPRDGAEISTGDCHGISSLGHGCKDRAGTYGTPARTEGASWPPDSGLAGQEHATVGAWLAVQSVRDGGRANA